MRAALQAAPDQPREGRAQDPAVPRHEPGGADPGDGRQRRPGRQADHALAVERDPDVLRREVGQVPAARPGDEASDAAGADERLDRRHPLPRRAVRRHPLERAARPDGGHVPLARQGIPQGLGPAARKAEILRRQRANDRRSLALRRLRARQGRGARGMRGHAKSRALGEGARGEAGDPARRQVLKAVPLTSRFQGGTMGRFMTAAALLAATLLLGGCGYNTLQQNDEQVKAAWSEVLNQYQRRADLVPNLVATVKGAAKFEQQTLQQVIEARAQATSIQATKELVNDPEAFKKFQAAQGELSSALSRLLVVTENYPQLKSDQNFRDLQAQLEGTENRITVARNRYIQAVQAYNLAIRSFPGNLTAMIFGYKPKPNFTVENEAVISKPPAVDFSAPAPAPAPAPTPTPGATPTPAPVH